LPILIFTYIIIYATSLARQVFATKVANAHRAFCHIDGVAKMPLQASIFTPGDGVRNPVMIRVLMDDI